MRHRPHSLPVLCLQHCKNWEWPENEVVLNEHFSQAIPPFTCIYSMDDSAVDCEQFMPILLYLTLVADDNPYIHLHNACMDNNSF